MTIRIVFFTFLFSVYCSSLSVAQLYTDEVQVVSGLGGKVGVGTNNPLGKFHVAGSPEASIHTEVNSYPMIFLKGKMSTTVESGRLGFYGETAFLSQNTYFTTAPTNKWTGDNVASGGALWLIQSGGLYAYTRTPGVEDLVERFRIQNDGNVGIGTTTPSQRLSVNGNASKATAGDWLANSDARLKTNISPLHSQETLQKMLQLQGITYEWSDDKTGLDRPTGIQYGFTAQNIQEVFPSLVVKDDKGYLQSSYSTYDAMLVESIRALHEEIEELKRINAAQEGHNVALSAENAALRSKDTSILSELQLIKEQLRMLGASGNPQSSNSQND